MTDTPEHRGRSPPRSPRPAGSLAEDRTGNARPDHATKPDPILLADLYDLTGRFIAYPSDHAHVAHVLWIAHTHLMDAWESTPRLAFLSPEPASGKTRALEITELLVPNPVEAINVTPAARSAGTTGRRRSCSTRSTRYSARRPKKTKRFADCSMPAIGAVQLPAVALLTGKESSRKKSPHIVLWRSPASAGFRTRSSRAQSLFGCGAGRRTRR